MNECKIKHVNVSIFELNVSKLIPLDARTNKYTSLPEIPYVEKDLSIVVDESVRWETIYKMIKSKVKEVIFVEEYRGENIGESKKSITLKLKIGDGKSTLTSDEINSKINQVTKNIRKNCKC